MPPRTARLSFLDLPRRARMPSERELVNVMGGCHVQGTPCAKDGDCSPELTYAVNHAAVIFSRWCTTLGARSDELTSDAETNRQSPYSRVPEEGNAIVPRLSWRGRL